MTISINEDIVRLDVTMKIDKRKITRRGFDSPMDITKVMYSLNGKNAFGHIKPCNIFREYVVLHQHCHQIPTW